MRPQCIACRHCAQQPGEPCDWSRDEASAQGVALYHAERIEDAAAWCDGSDGAVATKAAFEQAVDATGLV
jgi:hypothetical protein